MNLSHVMVVVSLSMIVASSTSAQEGDHTSLVPDVIKKVILDPTTYVPAIVAWESTRLDWRSSQIFFQKGWLEYNPRFTVSGLPGEAPLSYAAGNRLIFRDSIANLQLSLLNNVSERVMEHLLMPRYPGHRKLLRSIGQIERVAMASYFTYLLSADHLRQWQANQALAQQLGY
jgi:hypothetical protein